MAVEEGVDEEEPTFWIRVDDHEASIQLFSLVSKQIASITVRNFMHESQLFFRLSKVRAKLCKNESKPLWTWL